VNPALAVAATWARLDPEVVLTFAGAHAGLEERLVTAAGHRYVGIRSAPFFGVGAAAKLRSLAGLLAGVRQARRVLRGEAPDLVLGFGGYAAAPVVLAAASLGIPVVVHESNVSLGLANRLAAPLARHLLLGFEATLRRVRRPATVTGIPVGAEVVRAAAARRSEASPTAPRRIVVSGGTYGSRLLDERVPDLLGRLAAAGHVLSVRHLAGDGDLGRIRAAYRTARVPVEVRAFVAGIAETLAWAEFAITSAGAVTLAELAVMGVPALVVPQARVALDHQTSNAQAFAEATGARWVRERDWEPAALAAHVGTVLAGPETWATAAAAVRRFARPDAGEVVVHACAPYLKAGRSSAGGSATP
jgi:UDP-N-acetylglucosamine--N-acetylmuramyl-(pentapeptide) pyrophosphoryl-undecaprenol N-acetylglucosamine transferase